MAARGRACQRGGLKYGMLTILAIETSSETASVALLRGDDVLSRVSSGVRTHSQDVLPMIQELLAEAGIGLSQCDAVAFGSGPGSFTGVRTACGVAQGLAFGGKLPAVPVVTLDAMALACHQQHGAAEVLVVLDARMSEVYCAQYRFENGAPVAVLPPLADWRVRPEPPVISPPVERIATSVAAFCTALPGAPSVTVPPVTR